jgi:hypothetical protein
MTAQIEQQRVCATPLFEYNFVFMLDAQRIAAFEALAVHRQFAVDQVHIGLAAGTEAVRERDVPAVEAARVQRDVGVNGERAVAPLRIHQWQQAALPRAVGKVLLRVARCDAA